MPYIGRSLGDGVRARYIYAATSGQTTFSGNDANGIALAYSDTLYMDVYQNGVKLKETSDYAATTGTSVVLVTGASTDDVVEMIVYDSFAVADTVSAANGGTFSGNMSMGGTLGVTGITTATGGLNVGTIKDAGNNATAMTIDSSGRVLTPARPAFLARRNGASTSISSGNIFSFDSVSINGGFDTASGYNTSTYTYTCPVAGLYHFHVGAIIGSATYSNAQWKIQLNGSDYEQRHFSTTNSDYYTHTIDTYINASANDTVRVYAGTNLYFYGGQWSVFMGHLIG